MNVVVVALRWALDVAGLVVVDGPWDLFGVGKDEEMALLLAANMKQ